MSTASQRRWGVWIVLLVVAAWLALFGDKTPVNSAAVVAPTQAVQSNVVQSKTVSGTIAAASTTVATSAASTPGREARATAALSTTQQSSNALNPLLDRDALFPTQKPTAKRADLFTSHSWTPPPAPVKPLPPPPPTAPPLPFTYIGKKYDGAAWEVYVTRGDQTFVLREGMALDNVYRVSAIAPPNLSLLYVPLGQTQTMFIGESQ